MDQLAIPSAIVMFLMSWWCLSSLRTGAVVFAISVFCQVATLALVYYSGHRMNALLIMLPPLVQVLTIASAIHFTNYVIEASHDLPPDRAAWKAVGLGWLPCTLSSGTTMVGLASLMTSGLEPVREFGLFAAVGVAISTFAVLGLLPIALTWFPPDSVRKPATLKRSQHAATAITYLRWPIISVSVIVIILGSVGMSRLRTSVRIETLFGPGSSILQDYAWLEKEIGPLVPIEVVVEFPIDMPMHWEDKLATIDRVRSDIRKSKEIDRVLSPADFINSDMLFMTEQETGIGGNELPQPVEDLLVSRGMISRTDGMQAWRVTGLTSSIADVDYGELLNSLGVHLKDTVASLPKEVELRVTGIMPLVHQIQSRLLSDLFTSFLSSLALIFVTLTLVEGSLVRGFMTLLPNIFPIALLFGIWGWLDQPIDIGSVMTASIALGIAVDDTLHFVTFFRRTEQSGMSGRDALADSYFHCGRAMIQTTVCNATGLLIFAFSSFIPTSRFAWMMACLLTAALMGDLILLPALLYRRSNQAKQIADEDRFDESGSSQLSDSIFPEDEEAEQEYLATPMTSRPPHFFRYFDSNVRDAK